MQSMTHDDLDEIPLRLGGLVVERGDGHSKRDRIGLALSPLSGDELAQLAMRLADYRKDPDLAEAARKELEAGDPPLTPITRRDIARVFGDDLSGQRATCEVLERWFPITSPLQDFLGGSSLRDEITQHMDNNPGDWSVEYLFGRVGAFDCSVFRFGNLLAETVHPLSLTGPEQTAAVTELNRVLARDGYELAVDSDMSGHPIYRFQRIARGVDGRPKNLIFASCGPKPEIGFADAINNDIVILSGEGNCLVYDRPVSRDGLLWSELVAWWATVCPGADAAKLGARLGKSLSSDAEHKLFATYFKAFRGLLGDKLPALLPQVYLHYDPAIVRTLSHRLPIGRQRMDFLLLLPGRQRIVVEVDGKHHFSKHDRPSLPVYAEMVSADRDLRLAGYEVYRFGANELVGKDAESTVTDFFVRLFQLHNVKP